MSKQRYNYKEDFFTVQIDDETVFGLERQDDQGKSIVLIRDRKNRKPRFLTLEGDFLLHLSKWLNKD